MNKKPGFSLFNQTMDVRLHPIEDGDCLKKLTFIFKKTLYESDAFLLNESRERLVGIYTDAEGTGTSFYEQDGSFFINVGFSEMSAVQMGEMVSYLEPVDKALGNVKGDLFVNLVYTLENQGQSEKDENGFLRELIMAVPSSLNDDGIKRIFKLRCQQEGAAYTITSLHEGVVFLKQAVTIIKKERMNAESFLLGSLHCWLTSLKHPELIRDSHALKISIPNILPKNNSSH